MLINQHQQVLDFLKVRGGCANLRELQHFSLQMLERLQLQGCIDICKSKENGYEVILRESKFKLSNIKTEVEVKKVSSPSISIRKVKKVDGTKKIDGRKTRFSSIRDSILSVIKNSETPLNAFDIQKHFPSLEVRSIYRQLIILEAEEEIFSARGKQKYYAHQKNLLKDLPISPPGSEKIRELILKILQEQTCSIPVSSILKKIQGACAETTLREILDFWVAEGILAQFSHETIPLHFALEQNVKACDHLSHLAESDRKNKIIALLSNGAELYQLEMAEALGIKNCSLTYRSLLKKMVEEGILISRRIGQNSRIYYSLKESRKKANITISKGEENKYEAL